MTQSIHALTLGNITVRQHNGLFSLNDLHKASGKEEKHEPNQFTRLDQTQALIEEIKSADQRICIETRRGANGGTYACRELVIAYAAWISATFHLKVIRVFLDATAPAPTQRPYDPAIDYTRISPAQAQDIKELVHQVVDSGVQGFPDTWARLHKKFRVNSYLELPATKYDEACAYLRGKLPPAPAPAPAPKPAPKRPPSFMEQSPRRSTLVNFDARHKYIELRSEDGEPGNAFVSNLLGQIQFGLLFNGSAAHVMLTVARAREMGNALLEVAAVQAIVEQRGAPAA